MDWSAGPVTRSGRPYPAAGAGAGPPAGPPTGPGAGGSGPPPTDPGRGGRDGVRLWWFGGAAAVVLAGGLVAVLVLVLSGNPDPFGSPDPPPDVRPPLAQLCPGPSAGPGGQPAPADPTPGPALPEPTGPRTVDPDAGISYTEYGEPWRPWSTVWNAGALQVPYKVGQHFVTEADYNGFSDYHASILSAAVPAADNDALSLDLECVGRQVAADVRAEYYPQPNRMDLIRDERTPIGGRPAWLTVFRLHFTQPGLQATDELVAVACIDVGRPTAAVLFVSIPGTHRQLDWVVDDLYASVRVE